MKRILLTAVLALPLLASSCGDVHPDGRPVELALAPCAEPSADTKGYVTGTALTDDALGDRALLLTAYMYAQYGDDGDYFVAETFTNQGTPSSPMWKGGTAADPAPVYWPVGTRLDLLALCSSTPFAAEALRWGRPNAAARVEAAVDEGRTQDDILYGSVWHASAPSGAAMPLQMCHAQAWVEVRLSLAAGATLLPVRVQSVTLNRVYTGGDLTVAAGAERPEASWNTRRFGTSDTVLPGAGAYGVDLSSTPVSVSILLPEQEQTEICIRYTAGGADRTWTMALPEEGVHASWLMGRHYIYDVSFRPMASSGSVGLGGADRPWRTDEGYAITR